MRRAAGRARRRNAPTPPASHSSTASQLNPNHALSLVAPRPELAISHQMFAGARRLARLSDDLGDSLTRSGRLVRGRRVSVQLTAVVAVLLSGGLRGNVVSGAVRIPVAPLFGAERRRRPCPNAFGVRFAVHLVDHARPDAWFAATTIHTTSATTTSASTIHGQFSADRFRSIWLSATGDPPGMG